MCLLLMRYLYLQSRNVFKLNNKYVLLSKHKSFLNRKGSASRYYAKALPFDKLANLSKDLLLYSYKEESRFFKYLSVFGASQLLFWGFWGITLYLDTKSIHESPDEKSLEYLNKHPILRRIDFKEKKFGLIALFSCLLIGVGTAAITFILPLRIVKMLTLCKGGEKALITTYRPFGLTKEFSVPLSHVSCKTTRQNSKAYVSLKIKGKWFHFLVDIRGNFTDPHLFDYTLGTMKLKTR